MAEAVNEINSIDLNGDDIIFIIDMIDIVKNLYPERIKDLIKKLESINPSNIEIGQLKQINVIGEKKQNVQ